MSGRRNCRRSSGLRRWHGSCAFSRSAAYELANAWLATDGETGLPAVRLGRSLRIPRSAVERLLTVGADSDEIL